MWKIAESAMLIFLAVGAIMDVRTKQIPTVYLMFGTCCTFAWEIISGYVSWYLCLGGIFMGTICLLLSKYTKEGIGYGDSWMILNLGMFLGVWRLMIVLVFAFFTVSMAAGAGVLSGKYNRKTRISFFPFLLYGYVGGLLW